MHFTKAIAAAILAFSATGVLAAPLPQLAGEGAAANSILTGTDNAVGYGVEDAEDNIAGNISSAKGSVPAIPATRRQLAGEGAAADSILTDTDNGVGYGTENAEDNTANLISSTTGTSSGGSKKPPPPSRKRQLDKISNGAQAIGNAAGVGAETQPATSAGVSLDGTLTGDAANAGAQVGSTEETTLEQAGSSVPKKFRA